MPSFAERARLPRGARLALALAALVAAAALASRGRLPSAASPETQVKEALAALGRLEGLEAGAARVDVEDLRLGDVTVAMDGPRALVVAIADAEGRARFGDEVPALAYVGRERFAVERCAEGWCPGPDALEALRGVVAALAAAPRPPGARVLAWQIRVERDEAAAGEDYEVAADRAPRRLRARWTLAREGAGWRLVEPKP